MSKKYRFIKMLYDLKKITVYDVWNYADNGDITEEEASLICGPRPKD